ncbi:hypothetical protein ACFQ07_29325 [Actinomadura adrarensis]|uniref:Uncharacterized protein n=1 Tax=Actinomadura adrarensis TaxID=1819600 RepID=A0ABW3CR17_9ACTN
MTPDMFEVELRDGHVEPLRRYMLGDSDGLEPFEADPDDADVRAERTVFLAAVAVGVRRRFRTFNRAQIVRFVGDLRISLGEDAGDVDPLIAESIIRAALGDLPAGEIGRVQRDPEKALLANIFILEKLRDEDIVGDEGLEDFLRECMDYARTMLEKQRAIAAGEITL